MSHDMGAATERQRPITFSVANEDPDDQVISMFREATGRSGYGARRARAFLDAVKVLDLGQPWKDDLLSAFRDTATLSEAVQLTASYALGSHAPLPLHVDAVTELDDGYFRLEFGPEWETLRHRFRAQGGEDLNKGHLLVYFVESLTDLQLAARINAEITTSPLGSDLLALKCRELARAAGDNEERIAHFQHLTLNGLDIRSVINSGQRNLDELMRLLDRAQQFRQWLADKPIETDLARHIFKKPPPRRGHRTSQPSSCGSQCF